MGTVRKTKTLGMVVLHLKFQRENEHWLGECLELGTATFADSLEQLQEELREAVELHLNTLESTGERARFFREHGIKIYKTDHTVPNESSASVPVAKGDENSSLVSAEMFNVPALA